MQNYKILWADDEIHLLKAHMLFLGQKGYDVTPVNSGVEALEVVTNEVFDVVFLDENMPGLSGLETLIQIKQKNPNLPVVMITKSEEEHVMEEAIGFKIDDYLLKPINPNQILISLKKILDNSRLVSEKTNRNYQQEFSQLSMLYNDNLSAEEWKEVYQKLLYHEVEIENAENKSMKEVLLMQKKEANRNFCDFIEENYQDWINSKNPEVLLSHNVFAQKVQPLLRSGKKVFFIVIDNLRFDQWKVIQQSIAPYFTMKEDLYYAILPTTTAYARNALFSGMLPKDIAQKFPTHWSYDDDEGGKNEYEDVLLEAQLKKLGLPVKMSYHKIFSNEQGKQLLNNLNNLMHNDLNAIVFNFVDMLSHARTDMQMIKELAADEAAYRSLTKSWFDHSPLLGLLKALSEKDVQVVLTTDHGTIRVEDPVKVVGDKATNTNLRYKSSRNLSHDSKNVFEIRKPLEFGLPQKTMTTSYVLTRDQDYFVYQNNYNQFVKMYKDTFQHGGISMEEVLVPIVELKKR